MEKEYFAGKITDKKIEEIPYSESYGFLGLKKRKRCKKEFFVYVFLGNVGMLKELKIKVAVDKIDFEHATIGEDISLMLEFKLDFVCFHHFANPIPAKEEKVIIFRNYT